jgi:hypothetical protein
VSGRIDWGGTDRAMVARMGVYEGQVYEAIQWVGDYFAAEFETYAKDNAPWTDQTGNARQTLRGFTEQLAKETVAIYLAHGMDYGIFLELANQGVYAIILPTLEAHYARIRQKLQEIFS